MARKYTTREEREVQRALEVLFEIAEQDLNVTITTDDEWRNSNAGEKADAANKILEFFGSEDRPVLF